MRNINRKKTEHFLGPDSVYTCSLVSARSPTCHHDQSAPPPLQPVGAIPSIATKDTEIGGSVSTAPCTRFAGTGMDVSVTASDIPLGSSLPLSIAPVPNGPACRTNKTKRGVPIQFGFDFLRCGFTLGQINRKLVRFSPPSGVGDSVHAYSRVAPMRATGTLVVLSRLISTAVAPASRILRGDGGNAPYRGWFLTILCCEYGLCFYDGALLNCFAPSLNPSNYVTTIRETITFLDGL